MKKLPYREGDWFAVPLEGDGFAVGLVARMAPKGAVLCGYFFGPWRPALPTLGDVRSYQPNDAILVALFGDLGLLRGTWPVLGRIEPWNRQNWPMPVFGRFMDERPGFYEAFALRVEYPDDNPNGMPRETRIPPRNMTACRRARSLAPRR